VEQAITLSQEKYCSVAATVRGVAQITTEYEIVSAA
jgi:putative redox protein